MQKEHSSSQRTAIDAIALFFFLIIVLLPGLSIRSADWTDHLNLVTTIGILATVAGAALASSVFSSPTVVVFNIVYWTFTMGWQLGKTMEPVMIWRERIFSLLGRIAVFAETLFQGNRNQDPLMFIFIMGTLIWVMGSFGVWTLFRNRGFWAAVIPPGIALVVNQIVYVGSAELDGYLIFYVLITLLLASRLNIWRRQQLWQRLRAQVDPNTILSYSRAAAILAIVIVLAAWGGPAFAQSEQAAKLWAAITLPFEELQDTFADAFGGLRGSVGVTYDIYGESLPLEAGVEPADIVVMHIRAQDRPQKGGRFYWFSRAYDTYENGSWKTDLGSVFEFEPEYGDLPSPPYQARQRIEVEVSPQVPAMHGLYAPSQPRWASRSGEFDIYPIPGGGVDILRMTTYGVVRAGESYFARASVAIPTAKELRQASTNYPSWVLERYLQMPDTTSQRTRELAIRITEELDNPYDKAAAITEWLRSNIEYERVTIPPPEGVEQIDWFLFDYQVGFCNWYATAQVILLRSLGIPSRLAVGYARGNLHAFEGYYEVRGDDAHAWPEVFFTDYGWVEFEPTGNQSELIRPEEREPVEVDEGGGADLGRELDRGVDNQPNNELLDLLDEGEFTLADQFNAGSLISWLFLALILIALAILLWFRFDPVSRVSALRSVIVGIERVGIRPPVILQQMYKYELTPAAKIYSRWSIWVDRLGISLNMAQTPFERARSFSAQFPAASGLSWKIVETYVGERFGGESLESDPLNETWRELRPYFWTEWLKRTLGMGPKSSTLENSKRAGTFE